MTHPTLKTSTLTLAAFLASVPTLAVASPEDEAALKTIVQSVGSLADRGDFTTLETLFSDEVYVDYSSLSGQPAELRSAHALMTDWASLLPGFDRTYHSLSDVSAQVRGQTGSARANVSATHWLNDATWQVNGHYSYEFAKRDGLWVITAMTFNLEEETGSRHLLDDAVSRAKDRPNGYMRRQRATSVVLDFLEGLEEKDIIRVNSVWAEGAVQDMPFAPENVGFPERVTGKAALINHYAARPEIAVDPDFTSNLRFHQTQDADRVIVEYSGSVGIRSTGRQYEQQYIGIFQISEDGKISLFREYFDPTVFAQAFDLKASEDRTGL